MFLSLFFPGIQTIFSILFFVS